MTCFGSAELSCSWHQCHFGDITSQASTKNKWISSFSSFIFSRSFTTIPDDQNAKDSEHSPGEEIVKEILNANSQPDTVAHTYNAKLPDRLRLEDQASLGDLEDHVSKTKKNWAYSSGQSACPAWVQSNTSISKYIHEQIISKRKLMGTRHSGTHL